MCGIVGIIDRVPVDADAVRVAAETLFNRGPDDSGVWTSENVGFGHRRLAIIDLTSSGHQPMLSGDGRFVIVYNGEIYNFRELRQSLADDESRWRSQSDTEVILAAYEKWGPNCVQHFHGMFAFAIWDRRDKVLYAARDRMGVKPFYFAHSPECFAFASRPRAILSLRPDLSTEFDEQALRFYLESGYIPAPWSIFRSIRKLPPAHWLLLTSGGILMKRYWDFRQLPVERSWEHRKEEDLLDELDEIVCRSVRSRMISDVPLGAFLSGGIDSSLVVAIMAKYSAQPIKTFTIGFEEPRFDESRYAAAVSKEIGTDHHVERMKVDDLSELLPRFSHEFDEPFFDSSALPTMAVARLARQSVKVSLSGDGGDELFGGYHYYRLAQWFGVFYELPPSFRSAAAHIFGMASEHGLKLLSGALTQRSAAEAFCFVRSISKNFDGVVHEDFLRRTVSFQELFLDAAKAFPTDLSAPEIGMRLDACYTLPDDYLQKVDLSSMAFSLESRDPLLDQDLVEWAMKLPLKWKLRRSENKYLLRKLAYRYVSKAILDRPKQGFEVPIKQWLSGPLKSDALETFRDEENFKSLPLNQPKILELFRMLESGGRSAHPYLWAVLVLIDFARCLPRGIEGMTPLASRHAC
jgi:asparagine synthase (glutamine-hydrolysing)